jgi:hypothetical protein
LRLACCFGAFFRSLLVRDPATYFVKVSQQIGWVLIHAIDTHLFQFFFSYPPESSPTPDSQLAERPTGPLFIKISK